MNNAPKTSIKSHIHQASGKEPADLVIKNINIVNVANGTIETGDIAICGNTIIGVYDEYHGKEEIDGTGLYAAPGFIDTHLHIESSLVTPYEFERMVLPLGTTTAVPDPHEMANVIGTEAFDYFLNCAAGTIMDLEVHLSSCVPATPIGTSGATITSSDIEKYKDRAHGLAEVMNIPGVMNADEDMVRKLELYRDGHIDGHMPGVGLSPDHGPMINTLAAAGISTDHECSTMIEATEKQKRGIHILIREGTAAKNLEALMPFITATNSFTSAFCTDDFHPADITEHGHINYIIEKAISLYDPNLHGYDKTQHIINVYRMASFGAAKAFGFKDRGEIAPNKKADIVLLNNLEACEVHSVIKNGKLVTEKLFESRPVVKAAGYNSVKNKDIFEADLQLPSKTSDNTIDLSIVKVLPNDLITPAEDVTLQVKDSVVQPDVTRDILKCAVIERHGKTNGNIGIGFVKGFEFENGAIAASVGHDDHNITVVGASDAEMVLAVNTIKKMGGGYVVVKGDQIEAALPLPIAGLMSDQSYETVAEQEQAIRTAAQSLLPDQKAGLPQPLISLAFISLSVIPDIRICDAGITRNDGTGPKLVWDQRKP